MFCATSENQKLLLGYDSTFLSNFVQSSGPNLFKISNNLSSILPDLNATSAVEVWTTLLERTLLLLDIFQFPNLTLNDSLKFRFSPLSVPSPLDIPDLRWSISFDAYNEIGHSFGAIIWFSRAGEIIQTLPYDFDEINQFLGLVGKQALDFWKILNWIFVSQYWISLYDLGHIIDLSDDYSPDSNSNIFNNIFINDTLFEIYSSVLNDTLIPYYQEWFINYLPIPSFLPLNATNRIFPVPTTLSQTYSCSERKMKPWFTAFISVFAADYALIGTAYKIFIFIAGYFQQRKDEGGELLFSN